MLHFRQNCSDILYKIIIIIRIPYIIPPQKRNISCSISLKKKPRAGRKSPLSSILMYTRANPIISVPDYLSLKGQTCPEGPGCGCVTSLAKEGEIYLLFFFLFDHLHYPEESCLSASGHLSPSCAMNGLNLKKDWEWKWKCKWISCCSGKEIKQLKTMVFASWIVLKQVIFFLQYNDFWNNWRIRLFYEHIRDKVVYSVCLIYSYLKDIYNWCTIHQ